MDLSARRQRLWQDMQDAIAQRDRLLSAARDVATQVAHFQGAIALCDELLSADGAGPTAKLADPVEPA